MRIGHGFDVHAFGGEGPIIIGGVRIPYEKGLLAHSDGDVALHALTDALLGAAALGDIGKLFPIPIRRLKAPIAANCCAKHGAAFRPGAIRSATSTSRLLPRRRKCCRIFRRCASLSLRISAAIWTTST